MINNVSHVDKHMQQMNVAKSTSSHFANPIPPVLSFKVPFLKEKATLRTKKFSRRDNIIIVGEIDDDYVDIVEEIIPDPPGLQRDYTFFKPKQNVKKTKILKDCYVIDYIQSPKQRCGLGTEALKTLAEKVMFDSRAEGRIVTFSSPVCRESSPALFFYKLGFRFMEADANEYMEDCIIKKVPDIPPQTGMMYLPRKNLHKLLRYGDVF